MTKEQLKEFNGKNGKPAYIGYKGKVYDISKSDFWPNGEHMGRFQAGEDLTDSIDMSPHGEKNIFRYEAVDVLEDSTAVNNNTETIVPNSENMLSDMDKKMAAKRQWYKKNHPHPKLIHFPIGMFGFAFFVQLVAVIMGESNASSFLAATGLVGTVFGVIFIIPAVASGALSFYINYNGFANSILKRKMIGSILLLITGVIAVIIGKMELTDAGRIAGPADALASFMQYNPRFSIYSLLTLINMGIVTFIAANGGKLTWPQDKK